MDTERRDRQALGMAAGTALSRATGLGRTVALAWAVGVTALGDAYNTANTAPNMIFQLAAGGVLTSALVPLLVRQDDPRRRCEVASVLLTLTLAVGVAASIALALGAPWVMRLLTLGARDRPDYEQLLGVGTSWLRIFAPQVSLYAASVFAVGVLQSRGRLRLAGFAPAVTNLVTIAAAVVFVRAAGGRAPALGEMDAGLVSVLGWGTTLGVAAMAGLHLWGAFRSEPGIRLVARFHDPVLHEAGRLGGWVVLYVVVNQLGYAAVVALTNTVAGGLTAYQWAFTIMQLPYALVTVSILAAAAPGLARAAADEEGEEGGEVRSHVTTAARSTLSLLVPAAVGLALLADLLATSLVGEQGADLVSAGIAGFAVSLVPFSLFQLLARTCYAYQDTRTPATVNLAVNAVNVVVAVLVVVTVPSPAARIAGLALSHACSYFVGTGLLAVTLRRRRGLPLHPLATSIGRPLLAAAGMGVVLSPLVVLAPQPSSRFGTVCLVSLLASVGAGLYLVTSRGLGIGLRGLSSSVRRGTPT